MGAPARHALPLANLRNAAGHLVEQRAGGPARRRGRAVAELQRVANGIVGEPSLRQAGDFLGDVDLPAFAGVPRHASGYESAGRSQLPRRHQPASGTRLAVFGAGSGGAGLALLCRGRFQRPQSVVDGHAGRDEVSTAHQLPAAAGQAGERRGHLHRHGGYHGAVPGRAGTHRWHNRRRDGIGRGGPGIGRGLQLRLHRRRSHRPGGNSLPPC